MNTKTKNNWTTMRLKFIYSFLFMILLTGFNALAQGPEKKGGLDWYTDINQAQKISNTTKKPIFGFFTGSDWCGWCRKLQAEVFAKEDFVKWAKNNVVLLELDFPRSKPMSEELKQQNAGLQQTFKVQGYPTCWMFFVRDNEATKQKSIEALGSVGYPQGAVPGKEELKFIADADKILGAIKVKAAASPKKSIIRKKKK